MLMWLKRIFIRKQQTADQILKYPKGQRYYVDFHNIRKNNIDPAALKVISRLAQFGYKSYLVGGSVRDLLLGRHPKDFDIVTSAKPNEIKKVFGNSRIIGKRFKLVHIIFKGNKIIEVSTARSLPTSRLSPRKKDDLYLKQDNDYGNFKEDAARRDITINSLFFDTRNETIIDYTGGYEDIKNKIVRVIGDENVSLPEDPVRMLRAVKFATMFGFELHPDLLRGIKKYRKHMKHASKARLHEEFNKIFRTGQAYDIIQQLVITGLFEAIFPKISELSQLKDPNWGVDFSKTELAKRLRIADTMISEHEDVNITIYYCLLCQYAITPNIYDEEIHRKKLMDTIEDDMEKPAKDLGLPNRVTERIVKIFASQRDFTIIQETDKNQTKYFRGAEHFLESFIVYKINARAQNNDGDIQRALFWELGLRIKLRDAIRKVRIKPIQDMSDANDDNFLGEFKKSNFTGNYTKAAPSHTNHRHTAHSTERNQMQNFAEEESGETADQGGTGEEKPKPNPRKRNRRRRPRRGNKDKKVENSTPV